MQIIVAFNEIPHMMIFKFHTMCESTWEKQAESELHYLSVVELVMADMEMGEEGEGKERKKMEDFFSLKVRGKKQCYRHK